MREGFRQQFENEIPELFSRKHSAKKKGKNSLISNHIVALQSLLPLRKGRKLQKRRLSVTVFALLKVIPLGRNRTADNPVILKTITAGCHLYESDEEILLDDQILTTN